MVAAILCAAGERVICVAPAATAAAIRERGLELSTPDGVIHAHPEAAERLEETVSLLVVSVKAPVLVHALERVEVFSVADGVVLSLLNGLEHPEVLRRRFGPRVAPASISRFEGHLVAPGRVVQQSTGL